MIIIDTPPRMTLGTINAFVASHAYVIPTILDRVSTEAIRPFLGQVNQLKNDLELDLRLAGIVATMTRIEDLSEAEAKYRTQVMTTAFEMMGRQSEWVVPQNLPRRASITNEEDLGYFHGAGQNRLATLFYDPIFDELWTRIMQPHESP